MSTVDRIVQFRKLAADYRRDAEFIGRRSWWMRMLFVYPDAGLVDQFMRFAKQWDLRADELEAQMKGDTRC